MFVVIINIYFCIFSIGLKQVLVCIVVEFGWSGVGNFLKIEFQSLELGWEFFFVFY